ILTGVNVFLLEAGLDTGPVFAHAERELDGTETTESLLTELAEIGAPLLVETLDLLARGEAFSHPQRGEPTLAPRLLPEEGRIDWTAPAPAISRHTRAFWTSPGTWTTLGGARMKIGPVRAVEVNDPDAAPGTVAFIGKQALVAAGHGAVLLERVAPPGKQWMDAAAWARGLREQVIFQ
ncbi:MAG: methionyl-tRNA formyltransferase, partial [Ruaniaceae bacterium]|nr:methionyl-tRNA formyltransferase [Ruaniaceae bacterium]